MKAPQTRLVIILRGCREKYSPMEMKRKIKIKRTKRVKQRNIITRRERGGTLAVHLNAKSPNVVVCPRALNPRGGGEPERAKEKGDVKKAKRNEIFFYIHGKPA